MVDLNFSNIETLHVELAWEEDVQETGRLREGRGFEGREGSEIKI